MTPRQKRNLTLAKQHRIEKAMVAYARRVSWWADLEAICAESRERYGAVPEWYGHPPQGVTVQ